MTVYIEYVLIDNFIIDYLLIYATLKTSGNRINKLRITVCAIMGALFALLYPLLNVSGVALILVKSLFGLLLVCFSTPYKNMKNVYVNSAIFTFYTFLLGGSILGISYLFDIKTGETLIALIFVPCYFLIKAITEVVRFIYRRRYVESLKYKVVLKTGKKEITCSGFLDTGNNVYCDNIPVSFCSKKIAESLLSDIDCLKSAKKLEVNTVGGKNKKIMVTVKEIRIYNGDKENTISNVLMCIGDNVYGDEIILHPEYFDNLKGDIYEVVG